MAKKHRTGSTPATTALVAAGIAFTPHSYHHDPRAESYGLEAATELGVEPERVYKTLMVDVDGELVVAVVPVSGQLDLKAIARAAGGSRAAMADRIRAQRATGYVLGGISPIGHKHRHRTFIDDSVGAWSTVLVSGGRRGLDIEVTPADLQRSTDAILAPLRRS